MTYNLLISADYVCLTVLLSHTYLSSISYGIMGSALSCSLITVNNFESSLCSLSLKVSCKALFLEHYCSIFICYLLVTLPLVMVSAISVMPKTCKFICVYQLALSLLFLFHTDTNLGVTFDLSHTFKSHISYITKTAYHFHNIARLQPALSTKDTENLHF